jgi:hypothetical protein
MVDMVKQFSLPVRIVSVKNVWDDDYMASMIKLFTVVIDFTA